MGKKQVLVSFERPELKSCIVRVEYEEAPKDIQARVKASAEASGYLIKEGDPVKWPILITEDVKSANQELDDEKAWEDLISIARTNIFNEFDDLALIMSVSDYSEKWGPLFRNKRLTVDQIRLRFYQLYIFLTSYSGSTKKKLFDSDYWRTLQHNLYEPYKRAIMFFPNHSGSFSVKYLLSSLSPEGLHWLVGKASKDGEGFLLPNKGPEKPYREEIIKWCKDVALLNLNWILENSFKYKASFSEKNGLSLKLIPKDLYTFFILSYVIGDFAPYDANRIVPFSDILSRDTMSWAMYQRQGALAVIRNWKNRPSARNHITDAEYEELKQFSKELLPQKLDKDEMLNAMVAHLQERRKKREKKRSK
ncbi:MAG: hypothetical protein ABRQ26_06725 [Syntrophomonadaceae bacterium]